MLCIEHIFLCSESPSFLDEHNGLNFQSASHGADLLICQLYFDNLLICYSQFVKFVNLLY